ncbi:MAG: FtsK/SpoIIIE domain-containing protein [Anaerolineae bacterium]
MNGLRAWLDKKREGTHYSDRMSRILNVCQDCGVLWHEERISYRNGQSEVRRIDDIEPAHDVLVTPQYEKYGLRVNPRVLPRLRTMSAQFAYALNVPGTSVEVDGNIVYIRVPRPREGDDITVLFEEAWGMAPDIPRGNLLLGVDEEHHQLVLDLVAPTNVHAAVVGMTGSGKSNLMRAMILSAQKIGGARVALFDPSNGFQDLSGHPCVWRGGLFRTADECELGLEALVRSMGREFLPLTFCFVDEVPDLVAQRPSIKEHLARLAQAGRHANIHLIIGAQHPLASELGSTTMRNIPVRLVGRVADTAAAYQAAGRSNTGAESLRGRGDFIVVNGSTVRHFQAAYVSPETLQSWAKAYPPRPPRMPVQLGTPASPQRSTIRRMNDHREGIGRPRDEIPPAVIQEIRRYIRQHGRAPSSNWVYRMTRSMLPSGGFNRDKTRRAIDLARKAPDARPEATTSARVGQEAS